MISRLNDRRVLMGVLVLVTAALYLPFIGNEFVTFDDHFLVRDNEQVQSFDPSILWTYDPELYVPFTLFTYQLDHVLLGGSSTVVHLTNSMLHIITTLIFFLLLRRFAFDQPSAFFGALIFAVHPLQVESVAWASGRKELVYTLFFLLSLLFYIDKQYRKSQIAFLLSLLGKVTAVTLPVVLLCIDAFDVLVDWYGKKKFTMKNVSSKWVYFLLSIIFAAVALLGKSSDVVLSMWDTILLALRTTFFFFTSFAIPANLTIIHPVTESISISDPAYYLPILLVVGMFVGTFFIRHNMPRALLGFLMFFVTLAPSFMGYAKAGQIHFASEHYMYLPLTGLIIVLLTLFESSFDFLSKKLAYVLLSGWIVVLIFVSFQRLEDWKTSESLYLRVLDVYPKSHMAANNLAAVYLEEDRVDVALRYLNRALEWKPNYDSAYVNLSEALRRKGDFAGAQKASMRALELNPNIKNVYEEDDETVEDIDAVISTLLNQIDADPNNAELWWKLGGLYGQKEMYLEGIEAFQKAASLDPSRQQQAEELEKILEGLQ